MNLITLNEWADEHNIKRSTARVKALRGGFTTATKIGVQWFIDKNEKPCDRRRKGGSK